MFGFTIEPFVAPGELHGWVVMRDRLCLDMWFTSGAGEKKPVRHYQLQGH